MNLDRIDRIAFGMELWRPARIAGHRLIMGHETMLNGKLFALQSEVYGPGPFDTLHDVAQVVADHWASVVAEAVEADRPTSI